MEELLEETKNSKKNTAFSFANLKSILPFEDLIVNLNISGKQLKEALGIIFIYFYTQLCIIFSISENK